jgi:hypothetical protein
VKHLQHAYKTPETLETYLATCAFSVIPSCCLGKSSFANAKLDTTEVAIAELIGGAELSDDAMIDVGSAEHADGMELAGNTGLSGDSLRCTDTPGGAVSRIRYVLDTDTQRIRHGYVSEPYYEFRIHTEVDTCI